MNAPWDDWKEAEADLDLNIEAPAEVALPDGRKFLGDFILRNFGGRSGTVVIQDYDRFEPYQHEIVKLGYGFSTLEPGKSENYDRQEFIEMLSEWGWTGDPKKAPAWLIPEEEV